MARRYTRREFLADTLFMFCSTVLLKPLAAGIEQSEAIVTSSSDLLLERQTASENEHPSI